MQVSGRPLGQQTGQAPVKPLSGRSWLTRGEKLMPCAPMKYPNKGKKKKPNPHAMKKKKPKKGRK